MPPPWSGMTASAVCRMPHVVSKRGGAVGSEGMLGSGHHSRDRRSDRRERTRTMEFGIGIASGVDGWKVAQRAEELGFTHAWFYDTQMLCADVFVSMALAATKTSRIRLGTGVFVPTNRIAP